MGFFQGGLGRNPLDKIANLSAAVQEGWDNAKGRKERIKYAMNLKGRAKDALMAKLKDCSKRGCKGKRGGTCSNCGSKII